MSTYPTAIEGNQLFAHKDFAGAVIAYRKALQQAPTPSLFHNLGVALGQLERWTEAEIAYQESLSLRPFHPETRNNLGIALQKQGRLFDAETVLRSLLSDDPWNIDVATNLAGVLLEQGRPDVAIPLLAPIVRRAGHHAMGWNTLGACFLDNGELDTGLSCFARAHQQQPNNPTPIMHLFAPLQEIDPHQGIALLQHGLKQNPDRWDWVFFIHILEAWHQGQSKTTLTDVTPTWWIDALEYALRHRNKQTKLFSTTASTLQCAVEACSVEGLCLEFGTRFGTSARIIQQHSHQDLYVFDSFEGLPTDWHTVPKGAYSTGGIVPNLGNNVHPVVGWYNESLPNFVQEHPENIRLLHIDCDLYSSTKDVLDCIGDRLVSGTIVVFDEYWMGPHWREDEWKAWVECVEKHNIHYEYLAFALLTQQAVIRIL